MSPGARRVVRGLVAVAALALAPATSAATPDGGAEEAVAAAADVPLAEEVATLFREATEALAAERPNDAIAKLEALGDRGVVDAAVSFDRALAYVSRVRAGAGEPGDLGRAVHGFEEARELSRDADLVEEATRAVTAIRSEIARQRARAGESAELASGAPLGRAIVGLASENAWALFATVSSLVLAAGLVARARASGARAKVAGNTTIGIAGTLLVVTALLAHAARDARLHLREAVVVAPGTRLLDERHVVVPNRDPLAEGARVRLLDEQGGFSHVVAGTLEGWVATSNVLPLATKR